MIWFVLIRYISKMNPATGVQFCAFLSGRISAISLIKDAAKRRFTLLTVLVVKSIPIVNYITLYS